MKIKLLAAAALSLGVGAAESVYNEGKANTNEGNANTRYTQTIQDAAPTPTPRLPRRPLFHRRRAGSKTDS